ncbi:MAG: mechanosensitive ion channel family protein [Gemmatimonadetes bacterium]|nr:mechanosensitive ion channel family protein [Gemmatimonadota bacterium]
MTTFLDNTLRTWSIAGAVAGGVFLTLLTLRLVLGRKLEAIARTTSTEIDDIAAELLGRTRWYFITTLAVRTGSAFLTLPPSVRDGIRQVAAIAILLQIAVWGNTLVTHWLRAWAARRQEDPLGESTIKAIGAAAKGLLWSVIFVLALRNVLDYDISALLTGLGIGGIAIALAVQNILGDLFAALSIVLDRPFEVGDTISVDTFTGTVEHIGLKTTRVRAISGEQVIISNADLLKSRVRNLKRMQERRVLQTFGITYDTPPDRVAAAPAMLRRCVESQALARFDRAHFARFADSWLELELAYFVKSAVYQDYMDTMEHVNLAVLRTFAAEQVQFAFPTRTIHATSGEQGDERG